MHQRVLGVIHKNTYIKTIITTLFHGGLCVKRPRQYCNRTDAHKWPMALDPSRRRSSAMNGTSNPRQQWRQAVRSGSQCCRWWHTAAIAREHETTLAPWVSSSMRVCGDRLGRGAWGKGWPKVEGNANGWAHATVSLHVDPSCAARQNPKLKPPRG